MLRLAHEQMNMLGHDDISQNYKPVAAADSLKNFQEEIASISAIEEGLAVVAAER